MRLSAILTLTNLLAACATGVTQDTAPNLSLASAESVAPVLPPSAPVKPLVRQNSYSEVHVDGRYLALTFDDGPSNKLTPKLLDTLKQYGARCTFFVVGQNAAEFPEILQRAVAEGHEIANHSWSHPSLSKLSVSGIESQLDRTDAAIKKAIGRGTKLVRPPYGASNATVRKTLADRGEIIVLWSVDPLDWKYRNAERVEQQLVSRAAPGAILLAHDIHPSTVAAIPGTLARLTAEGYKFVTVSELLDMETRPAPVATASAAPEPMASPAAGAAPAFEPAPLEMAVPATPPAAATSAMGMAAPAPPALPSATSAPAVDR